MTALTTRSAWAALATLGAATCAAVLALAMHGGGTPPPLFGAQQASASASSGEPTVSAAASMSALRTTPTATLPARIAQNLDGLNADPGSSVPASEAPGTVSADGFHLLASNLGPQGLSIYAAISSKGRVCEIDSTLGGGCVDYFSSDVPVVYSEQLGAGGNLYGLAPDRVTAISLDAGGRSIAGTLEHNVFYFALSAGDQPKALDITYSDGSTQSYPVA